MIFKSCYILQFSIENILFLGCGFNGNFIRTFCRRPRQRLHFSGLGFSSAAFTNLFGTKRNGLLRLHQTWRRNVNDHRAARILGRQPFPPRSTFRRPLFRRHCQARTTTNTFIRFHSPQPFLGLDYIRQQRRADLRDRFFGRILFRHRSSCRASLHQRNRAPFHSRQPLFFCQSLFSDRTLGSFRHGSLAGLAAAGHRLRGRSPHVAHHWTGFTF